MLILTSRGVCCMFVYVGDVTEQPSHQPHRCEEFLEHVAEFARAMWTQFHVPSMVGGLGLIMLAVGLQATALCKGSNRLAAAQLSMLAAHGLSLFSNSYILEEGRVLVFFSTTSLIMAAWMVRVSPARLSPVNPPPHSIIRTRRVYIPGCHWHCWPPRSCSAGCPFARGMMPSPGLAPPPTEPSRPTTARRISGRLPWQQPQPAPSWCLPAVGPCFVGGA